MALLSLAGIAKRFDTNAEALRNVSLEVEQGEFLSLVGQSGSGKSTLLRIIAGLTPPTWGSLQWPQGKPDIGFVFQEPTLMPWADALTNVRLPLDLKNIQRPDANARALQALTNVGLGGFARSLPHQLSGGMKMRVALARALAAKPQLLLLDEPFAALDEFSRQSLNDDLLRLAREENLTVIFVTHSIYESAYLSSRVAILSPRPGTIAADITLDTPPRRDAAWRLTGDFGATAGKISAALRRATEQAA